MGKVGDGSGASQETTIDSHSFDNAFPTLTPGHPSNPHPTSPERQDLCSFSMTGRILLSGSGQSLADPDKRQEHRGDRENDRADRGDSRGG